MSCQIGSGVSSQDVWAFDEKGHDIVKSKYLYKVSMVLVHRTVGIG